MPFTTIKESNFTRISLLCLVTALLLSLAVIFLWVADLPGLMKYGMHQSITKFNTALSALLTGISFLLITLGKQKRTALVLALLVLLISCITLAEYAFHFNAGIDELFFKDAVTPVANYPGRMSLGSALQFLVLPFVLLSIAYKKEKFITELLLIPLWSVSFIIVMGYFFQLGKSVSFNGYSKLSLLAVLISFLLISAVFFGKSENGFLAPFTKKTSAAKVNGRALIISIFLSLAFGWLRLQGELYGLYVHNFGIVLMGFFIVLMLIYITRFNTIRLNRAEEQIKREKELSENVLGSIPGIFYLFDSNGTFLKQNKLFAKITGYEEQEIERMHPLDFFEETKKQRMQQLIAAVFEKGSVTAEELFVTKSGRKIPMLFTAVRMMYDGQPCVVGTGLDISERKKAEEEVQLVNAQLRELTKHMENLREEERLHIAREIHDELGQQITVLKVNLGWLQNNAEADKAEKQERLAKMMELSDKTIHTIRKISTDLRPPVINDLGLAEALKLSAKEFQSQTGINVNFYTELDMLQLSSATATALYRIYQECLTNIARFAKATVVESSLDLHDGSLLLSVSDNGRGFSIEELTQRKTLGVIGMRERAFMIGGVFSIHSEPGEGTHVQVTVTLENDL